MNYSYIINRLLISLVLILVIINTSYYIHISVYFSNEITSPNTSVCDSIYNSINWNTTYSLQGTSKSDQRIDEWYYIKGCDNVLIYVRLMKPLVNATKAIILIHDYDSNYLSILGLALELVSRNNTVLQIDLSITSLSKMKVLSSNYSRSWIYYGVCNVMKALTLLENIGNNVTNIGLIGIGFGGIVALITAKYDNRVDYAVSVAGLGNYERSVRMGSLINYYVKSMSDINPCLDPVYLIQNIDKKMFILVGTEDEINPLDPIVINKLVSNPNIYISLIPNTNRYKIPIEWRYLVYDFIDKIDELEYFEENIDVIIDRFEIIVKTNSPEDTIVMEKPMYFNLNWGVSVLNSRVKRYTYFIIPGEYIVINKNYYSIQGYYTTSGEYGFGLAILLFIIWFIINRQKIIYHLKNMTTIHYLYLISLLLTLFYIYYPTLLFFDRFHLSLYSIAELYNLLFPILSYLIVLTPVTQVLVLVFLYNKKKRRKIFYTVFTGIPLFTLVFTYLFILLTGTRLYYMIWGIPTFSIIPIVSTTILHYYITVKLE